MNARRNRCQEDKIVPRDKPEIMSLSQRKSVLVEAGFSRPYYMMLPRHSSQLTASEVVLDRHIVTSDIDQETTYDPMSNIAAYDLQCPDKVILASSAHKP